MTPERWQQVKEIFNSALNYRPEERGLFLSQACYTAVAENVSNVWNQPVDGGPAKQVTDFKDMLITGFAWSSDGKQ